MPATGTSCIEQNLQALAAVDAELARRLREASADAEIPHDEPLEVARASVAEFKPKPGLGGMGPPIFMLGCGLGRRLAALLTYCLADRSRQPVVVVEPDPAKLRAAMAAEDWRWLIEDPRVRWAVGGDSYDASRAAFNDDPCFTFQDAQFVFSSSQVQRALAPDAPPGSWSVFVSQARRDIDHYQKSLRDSIEGYSRWRAERPAPSELAAGDLRVFSRTDCNTTALKYVTADLLEAAGRTGHVTHLLEEDYLNDPFLGPRRARTVFDFRPDLVLNLIQTGRQAFSTLRDSMLGGVPFVIYYSSDPRRYNIAPAQFSEDDHIFVADPDWVDLFRPTNKPVHVLPLATSMHTKRVDDDSGPWTCDVAMVANLTGPEFVLPQLSENQRRGLLDAAGKLAVEDGAEAADVLRGMSAADCAVAPDESLLAALEVAATWHLRRRAAILLAEAGFDLRIYGNEEWSSALAETAAAGCWKGALDYDRQVPSAYHHAEVTVNVGSRTASRALNMRAFDVPAVGGCLVTNAGSAIETAFEPGREVAVYDHVDDLPRVVGELINNPAYRQSIATAGRARALRDHTYDRRWSEILAVCLGG